MAIPKIIHYCWFGTGKLPQLAQKCIESWKRNCPEFELRLWNEESFNIDSVPFTREAYRAKKYAFVTDYVRLFALNGCGGVYMDTDVEVIKPLDSFLMNRAFTGCESSRFCVTGTMASEKGHPWIRDLLDWYLNRGFNTVDDGENITPNTEFITQITTDLYGWIPGDIEQHLREGLHIYPYEYFCAKNYKTGKVEVTKKTVTIHHFSGSWKTKRHKLRAKIIAIIGPKATNVVVRMKRSILRGN